MCWLALPAGLEVKALLIISLFLMLFVDRILTLPRSFTSTTGLNKELMLHSYQIRFMIDNKKYTYRALLPDYFQKLMKIKRLNFSNLK